MALGLPPGWLRDTAALYARVFRRGAELALRNWWVGLVVIVYSVLLGQSVADISGKAIANLEIESLRHVAPTFHGDTVYGETTVLDKTESRSKDDRGIVHVETIGYKQDGTVVCIFRRKVMVPNKEYIDARGGEQPGRPDPLPRP